MKNVFYFLVIVLLLQSQISQADDNLCGKTYGQTVAACAQSLNDLSPAVRAGAQKGCVQQAQIAKDACMSGVNLCLTACQTTYDSNVATCNAEFDVSICGTNSTCQAIVLQEQANCVSAAVNVLNSCNATCSL